MTPWLHCGANMDTMPANGNRTVDRYSLSAGQRRGSTMEFGYFTMPSHPPARGPKAGHERDPRTLRWLDELGRAAAWIGGHRTQIGKGAAE